MGDDRRRGDILVKGILFLLGLIQTMVTGWCWSMSSKVETNTSKIYALEGKVYSMSPVLEEVRLDVKKLLARR